MILRRDIFVRIFVFIFCLYFVFPLFNNLLYKLYLRPSSSTDNMKIEFDYNLRIRPSVVSVPVPSDYWNIKKLYIKYVDLLFTHHFEMILKALSQCLHFFQITSISVLVLWFSSFLLLLSLWKNKWKIILTTQSFLLYIHIVMD